MDTQLIERMTTAFEKVFEEADCQEDISLMSREVANEAMQAAYEVAEQHILAEIAGPVTDEERERYGNSWFSLLAARITKYKAPKERVTEPNDEWQSYAPKGDGWKWGSNYVITDESVEHHHVEFSRKKPERVTVEPVEIQVPSDQRVKRTVHRVLLDGNIIVFEHADEQYAKAIAQIERERMKAGGK